MSPLNAPQDRVEQPSPYDRFTSDVADHQLTVLRDDGLYRHLRCRRDDSYCMGFDVITWPGYLAYVGDMGAYTFCRLPDMFEFFRRRGESNGRIDFGYCAEKCVAADKHGEIREWSEERFRAALEADVESYIERRGLSEEEAESFRESIEDDVLCYADNEHDAMTAVQQFAWGKDHTHEVFPDFWEHRLQDYTGRFVWCCYALLWAIGKYDALKAGESAKDGQNDPVER